MSDGADRRVAMRLAMVLLILAGPAFAKTPKVAVSTGPFVVSCAGQVQLCDPPATLVIGGDTTKTRITKILYEASSAHCSAGRLHVSIDGVPRGKLRFVIGSEQAVLRKRVRLGPGPHRLDFRFEGTVGGCNTGYVSGWGGQITVTARFPPA